MSLLIHTLRRLVEIGGGLLWAVGLSACAYQGHIGVAMAWSGWTTAARASFDPPGAARL